MTSCELCGKEGNLVSAFVEGVKFRVCSSCSKHGKVIAEFRRFEAKKVERKKVKPKEEFVDIVIGDYSNLIKSAREKKGLVHQELASKLNERESLIAKIEHGNLKPDLELAKKLEKFLDIKLIVKEKLIEAPTLQIKTGSLTIGDFIKKGN